jgi:ATP-dependent DNA helicase RecG
MERALKRLERVLELEKQQGYQNKAVVGGIRQFAVYWISQAREEATNEADRALAEQVSEVLMDYNRLSGTEARARAINALLESIGRRSARTMAGPAIQPAAARERQAAPPSPSPQPASPAAEISVEKAVEALIENEVEEDSREEMEKPEEPDEQDNEPDQPQAAPDPAGLSQSVTKLKGVGQKIAEKMAKLGVETIWDLLYLFPRRYDDFSLLKPISKLKYGEQVTVIGTIWQTRVRRSRTNQPIVECIVNDGTGSVQATWFNQPWLTDQLPRACRSS